MNGWDEREGQGNHAWGHRHLGGIDRRNYASQKNFATNATMAVGDVTQRGNTEYVHVAVELNVTTSTPPDPVPVTHESHSFGLPPLLNMPLLWERLREDVNQGLAPASEMWEGAKEAAADAGRYVVNQIDTVARDFVGTALGDQPARNDVAKAYRAAKAEMHEGLARTEAAAGRMVALIPDLTSVPVRKETTPSGPYGASDFLSEARNLERGVGEVAHATSPVTVPLAAVTASALGVPAVLMVGAKGAQKLTEKVPEAAKAIDAKDWRQLGGIGAAVVGGIALTAAGLKIRSLSKQLRQTEAASATQAAKAKQLVAKLKLDNHHLVNHNRSLMGDLRYANATSQNLRDQLTATQNQLNEVLAQRATPSTLPPALDRQRFHARSSSK